eukprot:GHVS01007266.1.p2 GENE.GHVS01007266.1~~GHVS01007266.1.p2  ORF type:complete len:129 (+),score=2.38 GHVS01007266.1:526-912(+)
MTNKYIRECLVIGESLRRVSENFRQSMVMDMSKCKLDHYKVNTKPTFLRDNPSSVDMNTVPTLFSAGTTHNADFQLSGIGVALASNVFCIRISGEQYCQPIIFVAIVLSTWNDVFNDAIVFRCLHSRI